jgi:hypothetical protein
MTTITTRDNKTSELSYDEGDANTDLDVGTKSGAYEAVEDDNRKTYECTSTWDFTLPVAATIVNPPTTNNNDYEVTVANVGVGTITVKTQGADTLDGLAATGDLEVPSGASYTFKVNAGLDGYIVKNARQSLYAGRVTSSTTSSTLPAGWSASTSATGVYTITHNLGLASSQYAVVLTVHYSTGVYQIVARTTSIGPNSFHYTVERVDGTDIALGVSFIVSIP